MVLTLGLTADRYLAAKAAARTATASKSSLLIKNTPKIGHKTPWYSMTSAERRAFQHSYSRHGKELGLPHWSQKNTESLRQAFNKTVAHIRKNGRRIETVIKKTHNGVSVDVNFFEATFNNTKYYYYETLEGNFISAGKVR